MLGDGPQELLSAEHFEEQLSAKHYCAGGSIRWMFAFTHQECLFDMEIHLNKVSNYKLLFAEGAGEEAMIAVNHLRSTVIVSQLPECGYGVDKYFFVSKFVAEQLNS